MLGLLLFLGVLAGAGSAAAGTFTVTGRFLYQDRLYDKFGYTGTAQDLPIRHADVEVVKSAGNLVIGTGSTDASGNYSIVVTGQTGTINVYVRCKSSTNNASVYHIRVGTTRTLSTIYAITTTTVSHNTNTATLVMGSFLTSDGTGFGVAQAFNILDSAVDAFDYLASSSGIARYPTAGEFVGYSWGGSTGETGSYYSGQVITVAGSSTGNDTDGWSDMVILHETGHWASAMFGNDHNVGGQHFIGDIYQDPRLSYGEGYATFFAAQVREFRAPRLNDLAVPVDNHVSIYADLGIPPALPGTGVLEFSYDFETGMFGNTGAPIGQIGSACETNVTSVMWDLVDGTGTPDETPGTDDEPGDETGAASWAVIWNYMTTLVPPANWISVDDFYLGWFAVHGAGFMQAEMESAYIGLGKMAYYADGFEPDNTLGAAGAMTPLTYAAGPLGKVVVNEIDQGSLDRLELLNTRNTPVTVTGWVLRFYWSGGSGSFVLPALTLYPGGFARIVENAGTNGPAVFYTGANISWANGAQGACTLEDGLGNAVDFVRWGGSTQAIPPGTAFTGALASAPGGKNMGRNKDGTDTDDAADFSSLDPTMGWPNFTTLPVRTFYPQADPDLARFDLTAGQVVVLRAESPHSAGEPQVELLNGAGQALGSGTAYEGNPRAAQLQFYVPASATYYARIKNISIYTKFAPFVFGLYTRPVAAVLDPPLVLGAEPRNATDTGDSVHVTWLNGGAYEAVRIYRDGALVATLPGAPMAFDGTADRGPHEFGVQGVIGAGASAVALELTYAGLLDCTVSDGLEGGASAFSLDAPWSTTGSLAQAGTYSLTDSPAGDYGNNLDISAEIVTPTWLVAYPTLEFDHICITEAGYDFGVVEVSSDFGTTWTELARYDMGNHPQWNDGIAGAGDWFHETIYLGAYIDKKVRIRFRLITDPGVTEDGWYVDNVQISNATCRSVTGVPRDPAGPLPMLSLRTNPFRGQMRFTLRASPGTPARVELFDVAGRRVRTLWEGPLAGTELELAWDGRDEAGRGTAAGLYFLRSQAGGKTATVRALKLP
jgi:hypothetical protein